LISKVINNFKKDTINSKMSSSEEEDEFGAANKKELAKAMKSKGYPGEEG
jgi:hypothetical protein